MHPITLCSILAVATILYELILLRNRGMDAGGFMKRVRGALLDGKIKEALDACNERDGSVAVVVRAGLLKHGASAREIESAMEHAAVQEVAFLERRLGWLPVLGSLSLLLGFLGTAVGMIQSFDAIAAHALENPGLVARGVSVALHATAWGLFVAAFTYPFHHYFTARVARFAREIEAASGMLLETLSEMERMRVHV
jgi:biopolymer transport protein ExbB